MLITVVEPNGWFYLSGTWGASQSGGRTFHDAEMNLTLLQPNPDDASCPLRANIVPLWFEQRLLQKWTDIRTVTRPPVRHPLP